MSTPAKNQTRTKYLLLIIYSQKRKFVTLRDSQPAPAPTSTGATAATSSGNGKQAGATTRRPYRKGMNVPRLRREDAVLTQIDKDADGSDKKNNKNNNNSSNSSGSGSGSGSSSSIGTQTRYPMSPPPRPTRPAAAGPRDAAGTGPRAP
ncbi:hypothetical protein SAMD00023353_9200240 [Rosellinia necatrix]|uniref:Uncharacterized protein n=1 Tax=Rosellinia necatrix TaxID=77044 RepID=A0A1W2TVE6_ROSNE|nr:hypothetical protein SAMD00023353_9200240 [Rosellinia necatrix]